MAGKPTLTDSITASIARLEQLRLRLEGMSGDKPITRLAHSIHDTISAAFRHRAGEVADLAQHPLDQKPQWNDMPSASTSRVTAGAPAGGPWFDAFGSATPRVINVFGNEEAVVLEVQFDFQQQRPLLLGSDVLEPQSQSFVLSAAFVCHCRDRGSVSAVDAYYDTATVLRGLGVLPPMPLGHDERDAISPIILHASGFVGRGEDTVRAPGIAWPIRVGAPARFGLSTDAVAKANVRNCTGIHGAFVEHDPQRFSNLIAKNAVWIDVPTGEVLAGAVAAATHDHGNWMQAFPDSKADVTNMVGNPNWVAVQHRGYGTHSGPLKLGGHTFPPTGRSVDIRVLDIVEYADGRAVLIRNYYDMGLMIVNLGVADAVALH